jgi:ribosomal protein S18 acetylase RimI-like enzyme
MFLYIDTTLSFLMVKKDNVTVRTGTLKEAESVHLEIPEFTENYLQKYDTKVDGRECLILIASLDHEDVGYMVSYNRYDDGSFYIWMTGVAPSARRKGILGKMVSETVSYAKEKGYTTIKIRTRNNRREMLFFLVKNGFNFLKVSSYETVLDNRILLEKDI